MIKLFGKIFLILVIVFIFFSCKTLAKETEDSSSQTEEISAIDQDTEVKSEIAAEAEAETETEEETGETVAADAEVQKETEAEVAESTDAESKEIADAKADTEVAVEAAAKVVAEAAAKEAAQAKAKADTDAEARKKAEAEARAKKEAEAKVTQEAAAQKKDPSMTEQEDKNILDMSKAPGKQGADTLQESPQIKKQDPDIFFPIMNSSDEERTVTYTMPGTIEIELERTGWIYTGEKNGKKGIVLDSRRFVDNNTIFTFKILENDDYNIVFHLQNTSGGSESSSIVIRRDGAEKESVIKPDNMESSAVKEDSFPKIVTPSERKESREGSVPSSEKDAAAIISSADSESNASLRSASKQQADMSPQDVVKNAAALADKGDYVSAIDLLEEIVQKYPRLSDMDRVYYLLAKYYEAETPKRNAEKSIYYYSRILEEYPLSDYVDESEKRIKYLEKHFIYIN